MKAGDLVIDLSVYDEVQAVLGEVLPTIGAHLSAAAAVAEEVLARVGHAYRAIEEDG